MRPVRDDNKNIEGQRVEHPAKIGIATTPTLPVLADRSPVKDDSKVCGGCQQLDVAPLALSKARRSAIYLRSRTCGAFISGFGVGARRCVRT